MHTNGHAPTPELPPLEAAQQRLAQACMQLPMQPLAAGISAFVNSMILSARVDAIVELLKEPPNATWTFQDALDAALARHCNQRAEQLETQAKEAASKIQVAQASQVPQLIRPS